MGYTHYFERDNKNKGSAFMFGKLSLDVKKIIDEAQKQGIVIRGGDGTGLPTFTEGYFSFNGDATDGNDHETFYWEALPEQPEWQTKHFANTERATTVFDFCKTARKPYDAVVCAVLIRAKVIYGDLVEIRSDGDWDGGGWDEWQEGRKLYETVFGEVAPCPMETANA